MKGKITKIDIKPWETGKPISTTTQVHDTVSSSASMKMEIDEDSIPSSLKSSRSISKIKKRTKKTHQKLKKKSKSIQFYEKLDEKLSIAVGKRKKKSDSKQLW